MLCCALQGIKDPPFPRPFPNQLHQFKSDGPEVWNLPVFFPGPLRVPEGYEESPEEIESTWAWVVRARAASQSERESPLVFRLGLCKRVRRSPVDLFFLHVACCALCPPRRHAF